MALTRRATWVAEPLAGRARRRAPRASVPAGPRHGASHATNVRHDHGPRRGEPAPREPHPPFEATRRSPEPGLASVARDLQMTRRAAASTPDSDDPSRHLKPRRERGARVRPSTRPQQPGRRSPPHDATEPRACRDGGQKPPPAAGCPSPGRARVGPCRRAPRLPLNRSQPRAPDRRRTHRRERGRAAHPPRPRALDARHQIASRAAGGPHDDGWAPAERSGRDYSLPSPAQADRRRIPNGPDRTESPLPSGPTSLLKITAVCRTGHSRKSRRIGGGCSYAQWSSELGDASISCSKAPRRRSRCPPGKIRFKARSGDENAKRDRALGAAVLESCVTPAGIRRNVPVGASTQSSPAKNHIRSLGDEEISSCASWLCAPGPDPPGSTTTSTPVSLSSALKHAAHRLHRVRRPPPGGRMIVSPLMAGLYRASARRLGRMDRLPGTARPRTPASTPLQPDRARLLPSGAAAVPRSLGAARPPLFVRAQAQAGLAGAPAPVPLSCA